MLVLTKLIKYVFNNTYEGTTLNCYIVLHCDITEINDYKLIEFYINNSYWYLEYSLLTNKKIIKLVCPFNDDDEDEDKLFFIEIYNVKNIFIKNEFTLRYPLGKMTVNLYDPIFIEKCNMLTQWAQLI